MSSYLRSGSLSALAIRESEEILTVLLTGYHDSRRDVLPSRTEECSTSNVTVILWEVKCFTIEPQGIPAAIDHKYDYVWYFLASAYDVD